MFSYRKHIKFENTNTKNGDFCEELLSKNDFDAVLVNFCCYEYGANASEEVQKIREVVEVVVSGHLKIFFYHPTTTDSSMGCLPTLKNETPPHLQETLLLQLCHVTKAANLKLHLQKMIFSSLLRVYWRCKPGFCFFS